MQLSAFISNPLLVHEFYFIYHQYTQKSFIKATILLRYTFVIFMTSYKCQLDESWNYFVVRMR